MLSRIVGEARCGECDNIVRGCVIICTHCNDNFCSILCIDKHIERFEIYRKNELP